MNNIVCLKIVRSRFTAYALIDLNRLKDPKVIYNIDRMLPFSIKAVIFLKESMEKPCYNAVELTNWAAHRGFGTLLFDIVLNDTKRPIIIDRASVSPEAKTAWASRIKYNNKYNFHPIDNFEKSLTKKDLDDCYTHFITGGYIEKDGAVISALSGDESLMPNQIIDYAISAKSYFQIPIKIYNSPEDIAKLAGHNSAYSYDNFALAAAKFFEVKFNSMLKRRGTPNMFNVSINNDGQVERKKISESKLKKIIRSSLKKILL